MRPKPILVTILALGTIVALGFVAYRREKSRAPALCQVCDRMIPRETAFRLDTASGEIHACCPACAIHYMLQEGPKVRDTWATDFVSGRMIPASSAYYDDGGDMQYCTRDKPPVEREPDGVRMRVYDRCLPTLVAFSTREEADTYRRQHGGRVLSYDEAVANLKGE
jgi:hypothetical protein